MEARPFRKLLEGKTSAHREYVSSGLFNWRLVTDGRSKLIRGFDPRLKPLGGRVPKSAPLSYVLHDLKADPLETRNFAEEAPQVVGRLARYLPPANLDPKYEFVGPQRD